MADDRPTHSVTIIVRGSYPHGAAEHASVTVAGEGSMDHMLDAFRAALVAAGFSVETAARLMLAGANPLPNPWLIDEPTPGSRWACRSPKSP